MRGRETPAPRGDADHCGCRRIEPISRNITVVAVGSRELTLVNPYLVEDLDRLGLWSDDMLEQIRFCDGRVSLIPEIPQQLQEKYRQAFEVDPCWCLRMTAMRGKWIDQSQSHTLFVKNASGRVLSDLYLTAWKLGLKTTHYLRTPASTQSGSNTVDTSEHGVSWRWSRLVGTARFEVGGGDGGARVPTAATRPGPARSDADPL